MAKSERVSIEIESIDLAAFLVTVGYEVQLYRDQTGRRAIFAFVEDSNLHGAIVDYERGAVLPAKRLLNSRSWLFREASRVVRGGA